VINRHDRGFSLIEVLMVVGLTTVIAAIAVPMMSNTLGDFRLRGDARALNSAASLAKLRAASAFTQTRLYVDLTTNAFHVESCQKSGITCTWVAEGGTTTLSTSDRFSAGVVSTPPLNTQTTIGQAANCVNNTGLAIANTACVLFNSRGIPVAPNGAPPSVGAPTGDDALYVTDGTAVYGITVSATGQIKLWRTKPTAAPSWVAQ
jgi:prepilin-type N-terminal cleavage/methylation domain-containing protein